MFRTRCATVGFLVFAAGGWFSNTAALGAAAPAQQQQSAATPPAASSSPVRPVIDKYCVTCHNQKLRTAGLTLDTLDTARVAADAETWEKVIKKLRGGVMPPVGVPRPDQATYRAVVSWLESEIDKSAAANPNPGMAAAFHRLNRFEYRMAVNDLLGLDVDVSELLPMDNTSDLGFDNNASQLSVSPALVDRYLAAARRISRLAVGIAPPTANVDTYKVHLHLQQNERVSDDLPFGSQGGIAVRHYFPADGEYRIQIKLQTNYNDYIRGMGRPHILDVRLNGELIKRFTIGGDAPGRMGPSGYGGNIVMSPEWENYMHDEDKRLNVTFPAKAGPQVVGLSFVRERTAPESIPQPRITSFALATNEFPYGHASISRFEITGPINPVGPGATPSRSRVFVCEPRRSQEEQPCARKILATLAPRAFRRPITDPDLQPLLAAYQEGRKRGDFQLGIQYALRRLLADPNFLFRIEREPVKAVAHGMGPVTDLELASRLSFFLWSRLPDQELVDTAVKGTLSQPKVFEQQVRRMLADDRAMRSLVDNFAAQWLQLRRLEDMFRDPVIFPEFDETLRTGFEQETKLFVESTLREDRSVVELLSANYTYLNERLARHYGIPNVYGERFRRVELGKNDPRGGLLGHGSLLTVTSYANRTSPVLRGKFLMMNILGVVPPEPPANVPALPEQSGGGVPVSVRARLEQHRKNPVCSTCHAPMDPMGFALENFDAIGTWRTTEDGVTPIDVSAVMPNGTKFDGPMGLRTTLTGQAEQFAATVTERLLAFALGRGLEYYDRPTVRKIVKEAASSNYTWSSLIMGVVNSTPFRMRKATSEPSTQAASVAAGR